MHSTPPLVAGSLSSSLTIESTLNMLCCGRVGLLRLSELSAGFEESSEFRSSFL